MIETSTPSLRSHAVWDGRTRWFHWINFVCVVALVALGTAILFADELGATDEGKILLKTTHVLFGYVFAVNLVWRIVWAFIGNRHAGWSALLPFGKGYGAALKDYVVRLFRGDVRPYLGHNPLARLMVSLLLLLLVAQGVGSPAGSRHPATILPYDKAGIVSAMFKGRKIFDRTPVDHGEPGA